MEQIKYSPQSILKIVLGVIFSAWLIMSAPTGWIYDLWAGTGTEQGQMPDQSVSEVHTQADVEDFFFQHTPATASKDDLIQCPLLRLRDPDFAGEHKNSRKRTVIVSEYCPMSYPINPVRKFLNWFFLSGTYNSYYLAPLEDGSYICVYFDDYLMLRPGDELPTGYVRYTTTEEKTMLHQMAEHYQVDPVYVLDMYRPDKVNVLIDFPIRFGVGILIVLFGSDIVKMVKRAIWHKKREDVEL